MTEILPLRDLTEDEMRGFRMACACFARWGAQIEMAGISLGGDAEPIPRNKVMQLNGRMVKNCARALELTLGT